MFAGMIRRPAAISVAHQLRRQLLPLGDEGHLFGDAALAGEVHLRHVRIAGARRFLPALYDPLRARFKDFRG